MPKQPIVKTAIGRVIIHHSAKMPKSPSKTPAITYKEMEKIGEIARDIKESCEKDRTRKKPGTYSNSNITKAHRKNSPHIY